MEKKYYCRIYSYDNIGRVLLAIEDLKHGDVDTYASYLDKNFQKWDEVEINISYVDSDKCSSNDKLLSRVVNPKSRHIRIPGGKKGQVNAIKVAI